MATIREAAVPGSQQCERQCVGQQCESHSSSTRGRAFKRDNITRSNRRGYESHRSQRGNCNSTRFTTARESQQHESQRASSARGTATPTSSTAGPHLQISLYFPDVSALPLNTTACMRECEQRCDNSGITLTAAVLVFFLLTTTWRRKSGTVLTTRVPSVVPRVRGSPGAPAGDSSMAGVERVARLICYDRVDWAKRHAKRVVERVVEVACS